MLVGLPRLLRPHRIIRPRSRSRRSSRSTASRRRRRRKPSRPSRRSTSSGNASTIMTRPDHDPLRQRLCPYRSPCPSAPMHMRMHMHMRAPARGRLRHRSRHRTPCQRYSPRWKSRLTRRCSRRRGRSSSGPRTRGGSWPSCRMSRLPTPARGRQKYVHLQFLVLHSLPQANLAPSRLLSTFERLPLPEGAITVHLPPSPPPTPPE